MRLPVARDHRVFGPLLLRLLCSPGVGPRRSGRGIHARIHPAITTASQSLTGVAEAAKASIAAIQPVVAKLGVTADRLNAGCDPAPCGTLADVNKTLGTVRGTFGQVEVAANHENRNLTTLDAQEAQLFADTHQVFGTADKTFADVDSYATDPHVRAAVDGLDPLMVSVNGIMLDGRKVADKATANYLAPWYKKLPGYIGDAAVIGAAVISSH